MLCGAFAWNLVLVLWLDVVVFVFCGLVDHSGQPLVIHCVWGGRLHVIHCQLLEAWWIGKTDTTAYPKLVAPPLWSFSKTMSPALMPVAPVLKAVPPASGRWLVMHLGTIVNVKHWRPTTYFTLCMRRLAACYTLSMRRPGRSPVCMLHVVHFIYFSGRLNEVGVLYRIPIYCVSCIYHH